MKRLARTDGHGRVGVREAARLLEVHENTIRNWVASGLLRAEHLPGSRYTRIPLSEVERLMNAER